MWKLQLMQNEERDKNAKRIYKSSRISRDLQIKELSLTKQKTRLRLD